MVRYSSLDDESTYYFLLNRDDSIFGMSDDRKLFDFFIGIFKTDGMKTRVITRRWNDLIPIVNANIIKNIAISHIRVPKKNRPGKMTTVAVPLTESQMQIIEDFRNSYGSTMVHYSTISEHWSLLRKEYREAMSVLFLDQFIRSSVKGASGTVVDDIDLNELAVLLMNTAE